MKDIQIEDRATHAVPILTVVDASVKAVPIKYDDAESVRPPVDLTPLNDLPTQINNHHQRALTLANSSIDYARKCGQALVDAKALLSHGEWTPWLRSNCPDICIRQVQRYMQLADNWPQIQAKREVHPEEMLTVSGALALISDNVARPNTTSKSHLNAAPDETLPDDDSMTDSNATSSRICQQSRQSGPVNSVHPEEDDATDESSRSRVSGNREAAPVDAEKKQSAELQPSVTTTVTNHLCPSAEIIQVSVAKLKAHKVHKYVYGEAPDQALVESIKQFGILQPLMVSSKGKVIVSGHERWEAAKQLGMETVPVMYVAHRYDDELILLLVECNRQRVKTSIQKEKEAAQLNSAYGRRRHRERHEIRKVDSESAEPLE